MDFLSIYWYGVIAALVVGMYSLIFTQDEECNFDFPHCVFIGLIFSFTSWLFIILGVLGEIRKMYLKRMKEK